MRDYLISEIAKREEERGVLAQRLNLVDIELRVLRDVLVRANEEAPRVARARREPKGDKSKKSTHSRIRVRWRPVVLTAIERFPDPIRNEEIGRIQQESGQQPATATQIRSHVHTYSRSGLYEKLGAGSFRATPKAATAMGMTLRLEPIQTPNKAETTEESSANEQSGDLRNPDASGSLI